jgi:PEGA domain
MRIPVSLLVLCAAITGCTTDTDSSVTQEVSITSIPPNAAVRVNGKAVGRTPTTITLERNANYELAIGKGGYAPESAYLKPTLRTSNKGAMDYGFPEKINVALSKLPGADDVIVPEGDEAEFKSLVQKANNAGLAPRSGDTVADMKKDIEDVKASIEKIKAGIATRDTAFNAKVAEISKVLADAKSPEFKSADVAAENKVLEAEAALRAALDNRNNSASSQARDTLAALQAKQASLEARIDAKTAEELAAKIEQNKADVVKALSESDAVVAKALANLEKAKADREATTGGKPINERLIAIEAELTSQKDANAKASQQTAEVLRLLSERNERLIALNGGADVLTKAEAAKQLEEIQKALEDQKASAASAVAEINKQLAEANDKATAANAEAKKRIYAEFNTRYALIENRHRNKEITDAEFKAKISDLRKELGQ